MNLYVFFEVVLGLAIMALGLYMHFSPVNATMENMDVVKQPSSNALGMCQND